MKFKSKLIKATIQKRYKRFLSDIELPSGEIICAHVPNTGSMKTCWEPGWSVYLSQSDNPKRKLKYTLELTNSGNALICVNTGMTNKIVHEALLADKITELTGYDNIKPEQKILDSRLDFYLTGEEKPETYVEVKNVTLLGDNKRALFPDSVTTRGQKHLKDLIKIKKQGARAIMFYLVNRQDVDSFSPAIDIDPVYASLLKEAQESGVEILVYQTKITEDEITTANKLPLVL
ncbi:MAG: DNA/RNA nuclease SfsA [Halobacteriovoraceae bacterium]|nr:DNA/RNA nuclease SfsA [Halobacteriovoraceae bacterium]